MAPTIHAENFVAVRTLHPRVSWRPNGRFAPAAPASSAERDYRDLLSEANENFFHREYAIALQNYLELRQKILVQSHPEMPVLPGSILDIRVFDIDPGRIFELSRRYLTTTKPGGPVVLPLDDRRMVSLDEVQPNPIFEKVAGIGLDPGVARRTDVSDGRTTARRLVVDQAFDEAARVYELERKRATEAGDFRLSADLAAETGVVFATYDGRDRETALKRALREFTQAEQVYLRIGETAGRDAMQANIAQAHAELGDRDAAREAVERVSANLVVTLPDGGQLRLGEVVRNPTLELELMANGAGDASGVLPRPVSAKTYFALDEGAVKASPALIATVLGRPTTAREVGLHTADGTLPIGLAPDRWEPELVAGIYEKRIAAGSLEAIDFHEILATNFVAYIPHLFFYVLPVALGDTYVTLGQYQQAIDEYSAALAYPFLNATLEVPDLWQRHAAAYQKWGDTLFRQERTAEAKERYERIINTDLTLPSASPLYGPKFSMMRVQAGELAKKLAGQASAPTNPRVAQTITAAFVQLTKIVNGLNFIGLSDDYFPVHRFKYLQAAANYLADGVIQAERTFIQFRAAAEQQKFERLQLESAVEVNRVAVDAERRRLEDAQLERVAAHRTRQLAELRRDHAQDSLQDWDTIGRELASVNAALAWASNAANDQDIRYTGVQYHGTSHDYSGDVEDFFDTVGEVREWLNFDLQRNRLDRQVSEAAAEVAVTQVREQQADVRIKVQALNVELAEVRLAGAHEVLEYATERMFGEDLWFQLAGALQDLSTSYLDMATYAAFVMQRAYDLEFDRDLDRIRLDYALGGVEGLLSGDLLKRDIASFTLDYLEHAQKQNPIRLVVSLREEFPLAFSQFLQQGILPFRSDLEIFDRRFPGTYRRKLKRLEVFVEGLVPSEGVSGTLQHAGLSTEWRQIGGAWQKHTRALPAETMSLSSYQFRRDIAVFQPSDDVLGLFENVGPQGNWRLELPRSTNNLQYEAISDVKVAFYLDSDHDETLAAHLAGFYPTTGGRSLVLSSRFHFPDQYFRLDADREVAFSLRPTQFAYHRVAPTLRAFGIRLVPLEGSGPVGVQQLTVTRVSDGSAVTASTDANGMLLGDPATMAPFDPWLDDSAADTFTVALDTGTDTALLADVELSLSYSFSYRPDGTLPV